LCTSPFAVALELCTSPFAVALELCTSPFAVALERCTSPSVDDASALGWWCPERIEV
jgi:hypothetical protein